MVNERNESLIYNIEKRRAERSVRFSEYKLLCNPFAPFKAESAVQSLADREQEKLIFADLFIKLTDGEIQHIFIKGKRGMGKTHLLHYLYKEINENHQKLGIPKPLFFEEPNECERWLNNNIKDLKETVYIFLDDAYFIRLPFFLMDHTNVLYKNKLIKTISCWQESIVADMPQIEPSGITEDFDEIKLTPLKENDEIEILKKRIEVSCNKEDLDYCLSFFDEKFFLELTKISHGNPRLLLKNASNIFNKGASIDKKKFSGTDVLEYIKKHGIKTTRQIEETLDNLTTSQKRVLYAISAYCAVTRSIECALKDIARTLGITRPAVINTLTPLQESHIVEFRTAERGRARLYKISEEYREFFEEKYRDEIKRLVYNLTSGDKEDN